MHKLSSIKALLLSAHVNFVESLWASENYTRSEAVLLRPDFKLSLFYLVVILKIDENEIAYQSGHDAMMHKQIPRTMIKGM